MLENIDKLKRLLDGKSLPDVIGNDHIMAASERYIEIISEASRHIPIEWKAAQGMDIPWQEIAAIGNILRHAYHLVNPKEIFNIHQNDLGPLQIALERMVAVYGSRT
jgi:uncharacterized protein with HEPN domain